MPKVLDLAKSLVQTPSTQNEEHLNQMKSQAVEKSMLREKLTQSGKVSQSMKDSTASEQVEPGSQWISGDAPRATNSVFAGNWQCFTGCRRMSRSWTLQPVRCRDRLSRAHQTTISSLILRQQAAFLTSRMIWTSGDPSVSPILNKQDPFWAPVPVHF